MAISMRLNTRRRTAVATATGLPRYARNDKVGTRDWFWLTAWLRGAAVVPAYAGTQGASPSPQPSPIEGEGVGYCRRDSLPEYAQYAHPP